jgi:hypothetical protein
MSWTLGFYGRSKECTNNFCEESLWVTAIQETEKDVEG